MESVSFVFQGRVILKNDINPNVISNITKVRKLFPESEIILSTWDLNNILKDRLINQLLSNDVKVVFSKDPGSLVLVDKDIRWVTNINRMIISSLNGIKNSSRKYVVKLRVDSFFYNRNLVNIISKKPQIDNRSKRNKSYALFSERVVNCNLFARHSRSYRPFLFHPGDIMLLGRKNDLEELFDLPLADESIFEQTLNFSIFSLMNYVPEQYIWVMYIKKKLNQIVFTGNNHRSTRLIQSSERFYINNFIPLNCKQLGFVWDKHELVYDGKGEDSVYTFDDWVKLNSIHSNQCEGNNSSRYFSNPRQQVTILSKKVFYGTVYILLRIPSIRRAVMKLNQRR